MAFDYGSIDLGLKNPFKTVGWVTAGRGALQTAVGIFLLITSASTVQTNPTAGWILLLFGIATLALGLKSLASGIYATLRYFVGRNHPTSLSINFGRSETTTAKEELSYVAYKDKDLEEMLIGRKNSTFIEPKGFLARILHTFLPNLLFMPYPIRNLTQRLFGGWVNTLVSLTAYGLIAFITFSGFAGEIGKIAFPIYSAILLLYLSLAWYVVGRPIFRDAELKIESLGGSTLVKIITLSLIGPVLISLGISWLLGKAGVSVAELKTWMSSVPNFHPIYFLIAIFIIAAVSSVFIWSMLRARLKYATPVAEVSELRENWQESVHPNEIFINLDNLVMANRRYKEVPNRVYRELDPQLFQQVEGKGDFRGELIQEVQPKVKPMDLGEPFGKLRLLSLAAGNILFIAATVLALLLSYSLVDIANYLNSAASSSIQNLLGQKDFLNLATNSFNILLMGFICWSFARLLANAARTFFAEIQFESLLVYFRCEGTFTESKISTGTSIHDSTRSENTLVRSSITPWVVVSRIVTTTFAATGLRNLEHPRHILEMHKDDVQLQAIREDVISFLKDRESIAAITSTRDLGNAAQIHQLNQQTRALPQAQSVENDADAAGYLRQESDLEKT